MSKKIPVGILGATGLVGKQYVQLLNNHPWFKLVFQSTRNTIEDVDRARTCRLLFSALPSSVAQNIEPKYAKKGFVLFSSSSFHRLDKDVPLIIPEINPTHLRMVEVQRKHRGWNQGCIISKPNCTLQSYLLPLYPLHQHFVLQHLSVTNLQSISGAGSGYKLNNNVIPYIAGEEEKSEQEPLKILSKWNGKALVSPSISISTHCVRVPVEYGHLSCVSALFQKTPTLDEVIDIWKHFRGPCLPTIPEHPLIYFQKVDRPQPQHDVLCGKGMSISIGRLRRCPCFHIRFIALSHNLIRGAAGGGVSIAELYTKTYLSNEVLL